MEDFYFLHNSFDDIKHLPEIFLVEDDLAHSGIIKNFLENKFKLKVQHFTFPSLCQAKLHSSFDRAYCLITSDLFKKDNEDGHALLDLLKERGHNFFGIIMSNVIGKPPLSGQKNGIFYYLKRPFSLELLSELIISGIRGELNITGDFLIDSPNTIQQNKQKIPSSCYQLENFRPIPPTEEDIFCDMIGRSKAMKSVFERIRKVAQSDSNILITGPSGTGKELVARAIHKLSKRSLKRMVSVNCGAIPADLLESELFGHVKGAFTGAISDRKGRFELANKGTIFLDEIGDMPLLLQVKILRVLQNREIEPVGSALSVDVDTRIITATHRNLEKAVKNGVFREDLFYRLNVIPVKIPPLSKRREDIPLLISHFLLKFVEPSDSNQITFSDEVMELLMSYNWPGNVRELENLIERLVILRGGGVIEISDLPAKFLEDRPLNAMGHEVVSLPEEGIDLKKFLTDVENSLIVQALELTNGNKNQASKLLSMNRTTLIEKLKKKRLPYVLRN